jgi:hypothetical protein
MARQPDNPWHRRVLVLSDGRSMAQVEVLLYQQELVAGAWEVDIGLWRGLFGRSIHEAVICLVSGGYLHLVPGTSLMEVTDASQARQR